MILPQICILIDNNSFERPPTPSVPLQLALSYFLNHNGCSIIVATISNNYFNTCHTVTSFLGFWRTENQCNRSVDPLTPFPRATLPMLTSLDL